MPQVGSLTCTVADGRGRADEFGADAQGAASAGRLDGARAPFAARGMRGAENHRLDGAVEFLTAGGGHVGFRGLGCEHDLFGAAHALEYRRVAAQVAIDPDTEIDFLQRMCRREISPSIRGWRRGSGGRYVETSVYAPYFSAGHIIGHGIADIRRDWAWPLRACCGGTELDRAGQGVEQDPAGCRRGARRGARGRGRRVRARRGTRHRRQGSRAGSIRPPHRSYRCPRSTTIRTAA